MIVVSLCIKAINLIKLKRFMLYINDIDSSMRLLDNYLITYRFRPRFAGEGSSRVNPNANPTQLYSYINGFKTRP